ncbi:MAG: DUF3520 domain-containing protein [Planctomycetaceae bacterium]|nr:DUF3520 domain-containing protein [Planctomycetaceae bacterium]
MNERSADEFDAWLKRELCDVRAPEGLRARLERIADLDDANLDRELRNVAIPTGLMLRLHAIPGRVVVRRWQRLPTPVRLALAASLLLIFGGAWLFAAMLSTAELYGRTIAGHDDADSELIVQFGPADVASQSVSAMVEPDAAMVNTAISIAAAKQTAEGIAIQPPLDATRSTARSAALATVASRRRPELNPTRFAAALLADPIEQALLVQRARAVRSAPNIFTPAPLPFGPGADLPLTQAEDGFLARAGVFPPLSAAGRPGTSLGLNFGVGSYDVLRDLIRQGQLPMADQVRTEELLAALSPLWVGAPAAPKPKQPTDPPPSVPAFNLTILGGPSPLSGPEQRLIVVGLRGRDLPPVGHRPTHLTVVVDTSAAMAVAGRLALAQRELATLTRQLQAGDQLTLVRFADSAQVVVEGLGPKDVPAWKAALASLRAEGSSEPATGIAAGLAVARSSKVTPQIVRRVVVLTHGGATWDDATWQRLQLLVETARKDGVTLDVIPLAPVEPLDANWQRLVQVGDGRLTRAVHPAQLQGQLVEAFARRPQVVLPEARLTVSFPANQVTSYRLLGHEPSPAAVVQASLVDSHLYAGHTTSLAFEIRPTVAVTAPGMPDVEVATVTVEWTNRATGERVKSSRRLMRSQLKNTLAESGVAWQTAALVASTAEVLRRSPFAEKLTLADIAQGLQHIPAPQAERPEFRDFLRFVEQADELHLQPNNLRRAPGR